MPVNTIANKDTQSRAGRINEATYYSLKIWRVAIVFTPVIGWFIGYPLFNPDTFTIKNALSFMGITLFYTFILSIPAFFTFCLFAYKINIPVFRVAKRKWMLSISGVIFITLSLFLFAPVWLLSEKSIAGLWCAAYCIMLIGSIIFQTRNPDNTNTISH